MYEDRAFHYVCSHEEARALVDAEPYFWLSNCGCREGRGHCDRSRIDVCLQFRPDAAAPATDRHQITRVEVEELLIEAETKRLVTRPYRDEKTRTETHGICFCCDDCCGYFLNMEERCDKGAMIESTNLEQCNDCLACADVCYFGARRAEAETFRVTSDQCYGCGLCVEACPTECISLVSRVA
jgi:ferredoxin